MQFEEMNNLNVTYIDGPKTNKTLFFNHNYTKI